MATRAVNTTARLRPQNRISRIRVPFKLPPEAVLQEYVRRRLLPPISGPSTARLPPKVVDVRILDHNKLDSCNGKSQLDCVVDQTLSAAVSRGNTSEAKPRPQAPQSLTEIFLNVKLSDYSPQGPSLWGPIRPIVWVPSSDSDIYPVFSAKQYLILKKLTTVLSNLENNPGKFTKELFRWLKQIQTLPSLAQYLTPDAWEALFAYERNTIPTKLTLFISGIMDTCGIKRTEKQECDLIGALFWNCDRTAAVHRWVNFIHTRDKPSRETWRLGVKLLSLRKEPKRAWSVYRMMKESLGDDDPKSLVPIVLSWNHLYRKREASTTFTYLKKLVDRAPDNIRPRHLKDIALSFLDANRPAAAFAVWRYMWNKGMAVPEYTKQAAIYYQNIINKPEILHHFSSTLLDVLKERVSDKYFYASWIKNLIRLGRPDLTLQVKEVMESNSLCPDSQHVNAIIQGFFRDGRGEIAEGVAGEMIQERLRKVKSWARGIEEKKRRKEAQPFGISIESLPPELRDPKTPLQTIETVLNTPPQATVQTFSILLHHFTRRRNHEKVRHYTQLMFECQIPIKAITMNHLLNMHIKASDLVRVENTFQIMVHKLGCKPDQWTWRLMWYTMWKRYTQPKRRIHQYQTPRKLFTEMVKLIPPAKIGDSSSEWAKQPGSPDIWRLVVRSFILGNDWYGLIVALNTGYSIWRMRVDEGVYKEIGLGLLKKGKPAYTRAAAGRIPVTRARLSQSIHDLDQLRRRMSLRWKTARLSPEHRATIESQWNKIWLRIRKLPAEEAAASLEAVVTVIKHEVKFDANILRQVEEQMGLSNLVIPGRPPPAPTLKPWMLNIHS